MPIFPVVLCQIFAYLVCSFIASANGNDPPRVLGITAFWLLQLAWVVFSAAPTRLEHSLIALGGVVVIVLLATGLGALTGYVRRKHGHASQS